MTEVEWLEGSDPAAMLAFLAGRAGERKLRLFACACARLLWPSLNPPNRKLIGWQEDHPDDPCRKTHWPKAGWAPVLAQVSTYPLAGLPSGGSRKPKKDKADLLREIFGNPFRPPAVDPDWTTWGGGVVPRLARAAHDEWRLPDATLDATRLAVLADALEDAGCGDPIILGHLRAGGRHVRGCWVVDGLLGAGWPAAGG
jgi:hypothetical protein